MGVQRVEGEKRELNQPMPVDQQQVQRATILFLGGVIRNLQREKLAIREEALEAHEAGLRARDEGLQARQEGGQLRQEGLQAHREGAKFLGEARQTFEASLREKEKLKKIFLIASVVLGVGCVVNLIGRVYWWSSN